MVHKSYHNELLDYTCTYQVLVCTKGLIFPGFSGTITAGPAREATRVHKTANHIDYIYYICTRYGKPKHQKFCLLL